MPLAGFEPARRVGGVEYGMVISGAPLQRLMVPLFAGSRGAGGDEYHYLLSMGVHGRDLLHARNTGKG